jgi:predicted RNA-binding protein YlxR (DUF448 family)
LRLVRTAEGVEIDPTGKRAGRGAYLHPYQECWRAVLRGNRLEQALRVKLSAEEHQRLMAFMATLPVSEAADSGLSEPAASQRVLNETSTDE